MPNKNTFDIKPIKQLILEEMGGLHELWIDPFANKNKLATVTNDLNPAFDTDFHMDALDFVKRFGDASVHGVLWDPPYSARQIAECYHGFGIPVCQETTQGSFYSNLKKEFGRIVRPGGKVISCSWNSGGVGKKFGFDIIRILLVPHGSWKNDTIVTVEKRM